MSNKLVSEVVEVEVVVVSSNSSVGQWLSVGGAGGGQGAPSRHRLRPPCNQ